MKQNESIQFSPSLMCMDLLNAKEQILILNANFTSLHIDIMDGHFCDSIHLSPSFVKAVRGITDLSIEVHLMVEHPEKLIPSLIEFGADVIVLHIESITTRAFRLVNEIQRNGKKAGIALCPITPLSTIKDVLCSIDMLTILTVDVGYAGQPLITSVLHKFEVAKLLKQKHNYNYVIQCDGGVKSSTYKQLCVLGAENLVLGDTALFCKHIDLNMACKIMREEFVAALNG